MVRRSSSEKSDEGVQTRQEEEIIAVKRKKTGGKAKHGCYIYWVGDGDDWVCDNDLSAWTTFCRFLIDCLDAMTGVLDCIKRKYRN